MKKNRNNGFTLLELLIVIAIIAILSVILVIVLNPSETLKKSRDAQRISDLSTMKTAIGLYLTSTAIPVLDNVIASPNSTCKLLATTANSTKVWYSQSSISSGITPAYQADSSVTGGAISGSSPSLTSGLGWIPINFDGMTGGSPISNLPLDPTNVVSLTAPSINYASLVYRYGCAQSPLSYEIDATLESAAYSGLPSTDGGNTALLYETGTNLFVLGSNASNSF